MKEDIKAVIDQAIEEDWFNNMTTSDVQGVVWAKAMDIHKKHNPMMPLSDKRELQPFIDRISDLIINGIYAKQKSIGQHIGSKQGVCSVCLSENIDYLEASFEGEYVSYPVVCMDCGATGLEWYRLEYCETVMKVDK